VKRLSIVLAAAVATSSCVVPAYGVAGRRSHLVRPDYANVPTPVDRWDNVMMLAPGTPLKVLMADGALADGAIVSATTSTLRLRTISGEVELAAADVVRIDRAPQGANSLTQAGVRGAAYGAGIVGLIGLALGHAPPPRVFLAGAIAGAANGVEWQQRMAPGPSTIYLAPQIVLRRSPTR
jgi:hypothetical protein